MSHEDLPSQMEHRSRLLSQRPSIHRSYSDPLNVSNVNDLETSEISQTTPTNLLLQESEIVSPDEQNQNEDMTQPATDDEIERNYVDEGTEQSDVDDENSTINGTVDTEQEESDEEYCYSDQLPYTDSERVIDKPTNTWKSFTDFNMKQIIFLCLIVVSLVVPWVNLVLSMMNSEETCDINSMKEKFPTQDDFLWLAFESGVQDVVNMNRPSTFILLYEEQAEDTLRNLLHQLSKYAACNITDCSKKPIVISDTELNSPKVIKNYGIVLEEYRDKLKENGIMIIKNLENIRGTSAQAFHTFCDEFTPLVDKSLFIFTMKVNELHGSNNMKFIEEYFKNKWTDIKIDTLNALITRITSMVIEVVA